ncbi:UNKNOWN [Stylonychia lemnae]|uniref:Uncharacterized protein n=1 Tax=Stylonychia lemnae TaxID=5949 RepID=A0A077ZMZ0_STYLE|nr:UNKNOWN [Stylonychia lemnae]|eukprot:CDW71317.1 UNKNOWN [Stylonychia lemnae]
MGCDQSKHKKKLPKKNWQIPEAPMAFDKIQISPQNFQDLSIKSEEDIFAIVKSGDYQKLDYLQKNLDLKNLIRLSGHSDETKKKQPDLQKMTDFKHWNMLHFAIYYQRLTMVRYLVEQQGFPLKYALADPLKPQDVVFGLKIAVLGSSRDILEYLWNQYYTWNLNDFSEIISFIATTNKMELIETIVQSYTLQQIFRYDSGQQIFDIATQWSQFAQKQIYESSQYRFIIESIPQMALHLLFIAFESMDKQEISRLSKAYQNTLTIEIFSMFKEKNPDLLSSKMEKHLNEKHPIFTKLRDLSAQYDEQMKDQNVEIAQRQSLSTYFDRNQLPQFFKTIKSSTQFYHFQDEKITQALRNVVSEYEVYLLSKPQFTVYHDILFNGKYEDDLEELLEQSMKVGINFNHGLEINDIQHTFDDPEAQNLVKFSYDICLKICLHLKNRQALLALLSLEHFWTKEHINSVLSFIIERIESFNNHPHILEEFFCSNVVQKYIQSIKIQERISLLSGKFHIFERYPRIIQSSAFSLSYINLHLNKETFIKTQNFQVLLMILEQTDFFELNELLKSNTKNFERLLRCIYIQNKKTEKYREGMKIVNHLKKLPEWVNIKVSTEPEKSEYFDDSDIENIVDEDQIQIQFQSQSTYQAKHTSVNRLEKLAHYINTADELEMLQLYKENKSIDALFVKTSNQDTVEIYSTRYDESEDIPYSSLNVVQLTVAMDLSDTTLGYFLKDHKVLNYLNQLKGVPGSILILNNNERFEDGASLILRMLISWARISPLNSILEGYPSIWTSHNLLTALQVMIVRQESDFIERLLDMSITHDLLQNSSQLMRDKFIQEIGSLQGSAYEYIYQQFEQSGYLERLTKTHQLDHIFPAIQDDNIEYLNTQITDMRGIGDVLMNEQENFFVDGLLINGQPAIIQQFNIILLCIIYESSMCLQELLTRYPQATREALKGHDTSDDQKINIRGFEFDTLGVALLAFLNKSEILTILLKQEGFIPSHKDFQSLIKAYQSTNNMTAIGLITKSFNMQIVYASMDYETKQKPFTRDLNIIIRPFLTTKLALILEKDLSLPQDEKVLLEILKGMSSDDYRILIYREKEIVQKVIEMYEDHKIQNKTLQNILNKIQALIQRDKLNGNDDE